MKGRRAVIFYRPILCHFKILLLFLYINRVTRKLPLSRKHPEGKRVALITFVSVIPGTEQALVYDSSAPKDLVSLISEQTCSIRNRNLDLEATWATILQINSRMKAQPEGGVFQGQKASVAQ